MAFLDNSRDIIIDAVLTDLGRRRLAEGKFTIQRFALGDDEINYGLYNTATASAYTDLEILQTPVFESFTNSNATMNSKLVTYTGTNLLYLPVIKLNAPTAVAQSAIDGSTDKISTGYRRTTVDGLQNVFLVAVDDTTNTALTNPTNYFPINGSQIVQNSYFRIDQGIDTNVAGFSNVDPLSAELIEDQYTVEIDNRFGYLSYSTTKIEPTFIGDDDVALYTFSRFNSDLPIVVKLQSQTNATTTDSTSTGHVIAGARGTAIRFHVYANEQLKLDTALTNTLFKTFGVDQVINGASYRIIHTTATVSGLKTGYAIDIPVSFIRKV
jgi:hypothetical protein